MSPAIITLIILVFAIAIFVTEIVPMGTAALIVAMALYFTGVIDVKTLFSQLSNQNVILVAALCVIGHAFLKTGMAYKAGSLITRFAKGKKAIMVAVMIVGGIMSGFLSNTGTVAVLMPVILGIATTTGISPSRLLMPLVFSATIGADLSIIGSPGNLIAKTTVEALSNNTLTFTFFEYAKIGIPLLLGTIVFIYFFGTKLIPDRSAGVYHNKLDYSNIPKWQQNISLWVLVVVILGMVASSSFKFLPPFHIIACLGAIVLVVTGVLSEKEAMQHLEMLAVFLVAFMLPLGSSLNKTGAGKMMADAVLSVTGSYGPFVIMMSLYLITWVMTQFMSNTAACSLFCPVAYTLASGIGADPRAAVIAVFIGSSVAVCTPLAIPANAMIMEPANIKFKDFIKPGLAVSFVCFVISMIILPILYPFYP